MKNSAQTAKRLKKAISQIGGVGSVKMINGISLIGRSDMPVLSVSNNHCTISTYTPFLGHKIEVISAPFNFEVK